MSAYPNERLIVDSRYTVDFTGQILTHHMQFNVVPDGDYPEPGTPVSEINVILNNDVPAPLLEAVEAMWLEFGKGFELGSTSNPSFDLWYIPANSEVRQFITTFVSEEALITGTGDPQKAWQQTLTFRSVGGFTARIQLMEGQNGGTYKKHWLVAGDPFGDMFDAVIGTTGCIRDNRNFKLIGGVNVSVGENEHLKNVRYINP